MRAHNILICFGLSLLMPALAFGSGAHHHSKDTLSNSKHGHVKPGAKVEFSHNYDGVTSPGESEKITLSFREAYDAGSLKIALVPQQGLSISGDDKVYFSLESDEDKVVEVSLLAETEGRPRLNIFVEALSPEGNIERRVFAVAININSDQQSTSQLKAVTTKSSQFMAQATTLGSSSTESVVVLPAQEVISSSEN